MATQWIPNIDSFFDSLVKVIRGARTHLSTEQVDSAGFWCRRHDKYERTLRLLSTRVEESRSDLAAFVRDLEILLDIMGNLREALDARSLHGDFQIDSQDTHIYDEGSGTPHASLCSARGDKKWCVRLIFAKLSQN